MARAYEKLLHEAREISRRLIPPETFVPLGGAQLIRFSQEDPTGKPWGTVVACANVPRPWHLGFDPDNAAERAKFGGDYIDRILYVPDDGGASTEMIGKITGITAILHRALDGVDSDGCSFGSTSTVLTRLAFFGDLPLLEDEPDGPYTVLAAKFIDLKGDPPGTMRVAEFWVAPEIYGGQMLADYPGEYNDARQRSNLARQRIGANSRRLNVREQVARLRATTSDPYEDA